MITRPCILAAFACFVVLPVAAQAQPHPPHASGNLTGGSQADSSGRAFLDESAAPAVGRSVVESGPEQSSFTRTIEPLYCQVLAGAYFSGRPGPEIPAFNYLPLSIRYGWELGGKESETLMGTWRNTEFVVDVNAAKITSEYGTFYAGSILHIRKNFADPGSEVIPYCQVGFGFILNDAYEDKTQRAIGHFFEYTQLVELGVKWMMAPNLSLDATFGAQHISNANLSNRNLGVNAFGGQIGLTYYFPGGTR